MRLQNQRPPPAHDADDGPEIERLPDRLGKGFNATAAPSQDAPASAVDLADASPISPIALAAGREVLFGATMDLADWAASHARAAVEAAYRADLQPLGDHLRAARNALDGALMTFAEIEREKAVDDELAPA